MVSMFKYIFIQLAIILLDTIQHSSSYKLIVVSHCIIILVSSIIHTRNKGVEKCIGSSKDLDG